MKSESAPMMTAFTRCWTAALEGRVGLAFAAGLQDQELDAQCARRSLRISDLGFRSGIPGVDEQTDNSGARNKFAQQI